MNSIESFAPAKPGVLDAETQDSGADLASDPAALEMLRAMMGGIVSQQPGLQTAQTGPDTPAQRIDPPGIPADFLALLTQARQAVIGNGLSK